jgi:hypothetical protein
MAALFAGAIDALRMSAETRRFLRDGATSLGVEAIVTERADM